jgi:integrase
MRTRMVSFPNTKNGGTRSVPMTETFHRLLHSLPRPLDQQALVLPALSADAVTIGFGRLAKALSLSNLKFHDLRHDVASTLTMAGVPQRTIMEILGHKDPRMSLRYQHLAPGHLKSAMEVLANPSLTATMQPEVANIK